MPQQDPPLDRQENASAGRAFQLHIVSAKLDIPKTAASLVARPHLVGMLDQGRDARLTVVSAPAGYGKTTTVAHWLDHDPALAAAWLTLDTMDNDLERFVSYFIAALRRIEGTCLPETEKLLSARNLPSPAILANSAASEMEALDGPLVMVLDHFESIRSPLVLEFMAELVPKLPALRRLVLVTRIDPSLPLSLWRNRGWLLEMRAADLRFSREETGHFFVHPEGSGLSEEGIDTVQVRTEGWAAGLRLAQLLLDGSADPEGRVKEFSASERLVTDYLMDEVLDGQPPEIREFLAVTSLLERFSPELCDALLAGNDSGSPGRGQDLLDRVYRKNLFLVPLGLTSGWYRYHNLFRQLLLDRHDRLQPTMPRIEILRRAAAWFYEEGWFEDCLKCHLAAGDLDEAAEVIGEHLNEVIVDDLSRRNLFRWINLFPDGAERGRLPLLVTLAYLRALRTDSDGVEACLRVVDETCLDAGDERRRSWWRSFQKDLEWFRCFVSFWKGDMEGACRHGRRVLAEATHSREFAVMSSLMYYGGSLALTGRRAEYRRFVDPATTRPDSADGPEQLPFLVVKSVIHIYRGELEQGRSSATRLMLRTDCPVPKYFEALGGLVLGVDAYERDRLDEARRYFLEVESRRFDAPALAYHGAAMGLARIELALGNVASSRRFAAAANSFAVQTRSALLARASGSFDRLAGLAAGEPQDDATPPPQDPDFMWLSVVAPSFDWALVQIRSQSPETRRSALDFIDAALELAEAHGVARRIIQLSALKSLALDVLDRRDEAITILEETLRKGAELGFVRSFADCGEGIRELLHAVAERNPPEGPVADHVAAVAAALRSPPAESAPRAAAAAIGSGSARVKLTETSSGRAYAKELTNRELDVLDLLHQRWSNKEIAARLGISAATVKMHTLNIYGKLGVNGRRQAVAEAVERGILPL